MDLEKFVRALPEHLPPNPERDWKIAHPGKISRPVAEVVVGLLAGIATLAVVVRIFIHIRKRHGLFLDDYIVLLATACLLAETAVLYHNLDMIYTETTLAMGLQNIVLFTRGQVMALMDSFLSWSNVFQTVAWTGTYLIKFSFLAFFRGILRDVSRRLNMYWWFVLIFTLASWLFNATENMIICGASTSTATESQNCFPYPRFNHEIGGSSTAADILSDLMIISIPILLLRKTRLSFAQKSRILTFLCLSVAMVGFAIARFAGGLVHDSSGVLTYSLLWTTIWLHFECSIAVLMGGMTAFRTVFVRESHDDKDPAKDDNHSHSALLRYVRRIFGRSKSGGSLDTIDAEKGTGLRLEGPKTTGTLKGMRTYIRRFQRQPGNTTVEQSVSSDYDPLESYHNYMRREGHGKSASDVALGKKSASIDTYDLPERPLPVLQTHNIL